MGGATPQATTILVVDDNEANRLLARETLEDEGYLVLLATGGEEGIAVFEKEQPDCVLLDVRMPGVDGFAACERIRALPTGADVPILFLTALRDVDTFDRALRSGGDDFLTKPVRPTELVVRVQTALKLRRLGAELREQLGVLKEQRDAMFRLQLQKERLSAFVVHDLKNPVNSMDLHAQLLLRDKNLPESARESATQIRIEARQLNRMIMNLLDVSKGDEGKLVAKLDEIDLRALTDEVVTELTPNAHARGVRLTMDLQVETVRADADLLRRLLGNLVENSTRYAPKGTTVTIGIKTVGGSVELRVADQGAGIPIEMREKVFDPFVQVDSGEKFVAHGSRGLGLTFCRLAVEAHGGKIWVEDASPGAVFCVGWPVS